VGVGWGGISRGFNPGSTQLSGARGGGIWAKNRKPKLWGLGFRERNVGSSDLDSGGFVGWGKPGVWVLGQRN